MNALSEGIRIEAVTKAFGPKKVLDGVDLFIAPGEQRVILGRSGQGKSVLLKLVVGLLALDGGEILVDGVRVRDLDRKGLYILRRRFSMVFQGGALFDSLTILENVALGLREHSSLPDSEIRRRAEGALGRVGLINVGSQLPSELSGGMRKRASLARAIVTEPAVLLYDEPTTGLDPISADSINRLIRDLAEDLGVTSIVVTHDMRSAFEVGDRFALLNDGKILFEGSAQEAREEKGGAMEQFIAGRVEGPLESF